MSRRNRDRAVELWLLPAALVLLWEALSRLGLISAAVSAPSAMLAAGWQMAASGTLLHIFGLDRAGAGWELVLGGAAGGALGLIGVAARRLAGRRPGPHLLP